jgi:hypothetical protein
VKNSGEWKNSGKTRGSMGKTRMISGFRGSICHLAKEESQAIQPAKEEFSIFVKFLDLALEFLVHFTIFAFGGK